MLMSLDGKISTGLSDERDFDKDLHTIDTLNPGLQQYYDLEQETDLFSLNSGKVMAKVGWNQPKNKIEKLPVSFVIVDNKPHLTAQGVTNLLLHTKKLLVVTTNPNHPANKVTDDNLEVLNYQSEINFKNLFEKLYADNVVHITIQSGGELNAVLLRAGLINELSIVVAPLLVGGREAPTLVDGDTLASSQDLRKLKPLKLIDSEVLTDSYLHLRYEVLN